MTITAPITSSIASAVAYPLRGDVVNAPVLQAFCAEQSGIIKGLMTGEGTMSFARSSSATVMDFEGLVKTTLVDELRFVNARRVQTLATGLVTETITVKTANDYQLTINGDSGATAVCSGAFSGTLTADGVNRISWPDGTPKTTGSTSLTITVTGTLTEMLLEDVEGQANQNPSENVPITGAVTNYSHADGVRCYAHENGNTVDGSGVVTEAKGTAIAGWYALFEPASTNYSDGDDDLSGGAETVDLTAGGTGDYTLSVYGTAAVTVAAGTATGTGFGQATEGADITFNLTGAGTVTLTLDSGSLDKTDGVAQKQVEQNLVSTSWIPTSGGPGGRAADDATPFAQLIGNVDETKGMLVFDAKVAVASADLPATTAVISLSDTVENLYWLRSQPAQLRSHDGTITAWDGLAFAADHHYRFAVRWKAALNYQVGYRDIDGAGSWQWGPTQPFDGAFLIGTGINIVYGGPSVPLQIKEMDIYLDDHGTGWIEDNY